MKRLKTKKAEYPDMAYDDLPTPIALHLSTFQYRRGKQPVWHDAKTGTWHIYRYSDAARVLTDTRNFAAAHCLGSYSSAFGGISEPPPTIAQRRPVVRSIMREALTPRAVLQMQPYIERTAAALVDSLLPAGKLEVMSDLARPLAASMLGELRRLSSIDVEGERLTDDEVAASCYYFMAAACATLSDTLGNTLLLLSMQPDVLKRLRQQPPPLYSTVEEALRYLPAVWTVHRTLIAPLALGGQNLPQGADVCVWLVSANHDREQFDHPERFDIDRIPNRHLTFGDEGMFSCPVGRMTRLVARLALAALVKRVSSLELAPGEAVEFASPAEPCGPDKPLAVEHGAELAEPWAARNFSPARCSPTKLAVVFEDRVRV